jgi:voltage-gated potassium channel
VDFKLLVKKLKYDVWELIEEPTGIYTKLFNTSLILLIAFNVIATILETIEPLYLKHQIFFDSFEIISLLIFTLEYLARLWVCTFNERYSQPYGRTKYILSPMALIDLLSILPFFFPVLFPDLRFMRILRFLRIFRILRLGRFSKTMRVLQRTLQAKKEALFVTLVMAGILLIFASGLMYIAEHNARPDIFTSYLDSLWWAVVTLTTVGYGDIFPITPFGKIIGAAIAFMGIGLFALPAGILASGFSDEIQKEKEEDNCLTGNGCCPHCGKKIKGA